MAEDKVSEERKKERHRSPNYPAVSLREAVDRVRKLYAADGRAGAPPEIAAKHIGYSSAHGQAMAVVAALKKFGLVSDVNGRLVPSQWATEIINLPESDPRRSAAIHEAALSPPIYRELIESHKATGLPADDVLEAELVTYKGFNPKAVAGFVQDFKDTLNFAGITVSDEIESPSMSVSAEQTHAVNPINPQINKGLVSDFGPVLPLPVSNAWTWTLSMPRNVKAELRIAGDATKGDIARLKKQIEFLEESFDEENAK